MGRKGNGGKRGRERRGKEGREERGEEEKGRGGKVKGRRRVAPWVLGDGWTPLSESTDYGD